MPIWCLLHCQHLRTDHQAEDTSTKATELWVCSAHNVHMHILAASLACATSTLVATSGRMEIQLARGVPALVRESDPDLFA